MLARELADGVAGLVKVIVAHQLDSGSANSGLVGSDVDGMMDLMIEDERIAFIGQPGLRRC
ncbi:hypothetical protein MPS_3940 [Mycobacterium pseudoshottsii JCM 15466]|nr:hypothetical protein MPS_3940 [Mycobacterium pseudoshottsii JCM 15466]